MKRDLVDGARPYQPLSVVPFSAPHPVPCSTLADSPTPASPWPLSPASIYGAKTRAGGRSATWVALTAPFLRLMVVCWGSAALHCPCPALSRVHVPRYSCS